METPVNALEKDQPESTTWFSYAEAESVWRSLESRGAVRHAFHRFAWLQQWQKTIGLARGFNPILVHVRRSGENAAEALLPLSLGLHSGLRRLTWAGEGISDYQGPLIAPEGAFTPEELLQIIKRIARENSCDFVDLDRMPITLDHPAWPGAKLLHYHAHSMRIPLDLDNYLDAKLTSKERYNLRRSEKHMAEQGALELVVAEGADQKALFTEIMIEFKHARYRATDAADPLSDPVVAQFYRTAAVDPECCVHASLLRAGGETVAIHWGVLNNDTLYYLMPAFAPKRFDRLSPGTIFFIRFLRLCSAAGIRILDFTIGDEAYKQKWEDRETDLCRLVLGISLKGKAAALFSDVVSYLRTNQRLRNAVNAVRMLMRRLVRGKIHIKQEPGL